MENIEMVLRPFEQNQDFLEDYVRQGIEKNRKTFFRLRFTDQAGNPIPGVRAEVKQVKHDFKFGANCFMLDEIADPIKNETYKTLFKDLFNLATLPFYWKDLEVTPDKPRFSKDSPKVYRRPAPDLCLEFCEKNGITPKEHCLTYDQFTPDWAPNDVFALKRLYEKRYAELSARYAHRIPGWEVINETLCRGKTVLFEQPDLVEWAFKLAERYFPTNELIINEANGNWANFKYNRSAYYMQIERALGKGCRIDAVGLQYHMFIRAENYLAETRDYYNPRWLAKVLGQYADFGLPLQMTEVTIPAYAPGAEAEEIQAEILRNLYSLWFAAPGMEAIIYWNLIDGFAYNAEPGDMKAGENYFYGGLVSFDGTPKKAYHVLKELIQKTWRTDTTVMADAGGEGTFKGFYGDYAVKAVAPDGRGLETLVHFPKKGGDSVKLILGL